MLLDIWSDSSGQLLEDGQCLLNLNGKENAQKLSTFAKDLNFQTRKADDPTAPIKTTIITEVTISQPLLRG